MVEIGYTRWFVGALEQPLQGGMCRWIMSLTPEAHVYVIAGSADYVSIHTRVFELNRVQPMCLGADEKDRRMRAMASSLAWEATQWCFLQGIIRGEVEAWSGRALTRIVECCRKGICEVPEQVLMVNLVEIEQRLRGIDRQAIADEARTHAERIRMAEDAMREVDKTQRQRDAALKASANLLVSWLTSEEKAEAAAKQAITVRTGYGTFVVPVGHGKVRRYVGGRPEGEYCVIFDDSSIPVGDEVLMKVTLLKTDPERFLRTANRFEVGQWAEPLEA